jgi:2-polyprenyl-6-methoxyphenol hydroxylase-like FAD-dependent oxidoreductase
MLKRQTAEVCIVGCGPVGMALKAMLDKFRVHSIIVEKHPSLQQHPKAHYLSFRTCEILSDLGMRN